MFAAQRVSYNQTNSFSKIVTAYLSGDENLQPFYSLPPTIEGIKAKIEERKKFSTNRTTLVEVLKEQYASLPTTEAVQQNIDSLLSPNTFTVCTAHQPNLFTGPIYFIYKILHAIKLAHHLKQQLPSNHFVPVYYMGSEDADFAELNHTYVDGKKLEWKKEQRGAVGRMLVDKTLLDLINELESQVVVEAHGREVIQLLRNAYVAGKTVQEATFGLVNELYGAYGLVVLIPDHPRLKAQMKGVFEDDLFTNKPSQIVQKTSERISEHFTAQAHPRDINLFYLKDNIRERIEKKDDRYLVLNTDISFTEQELRKELNEHPQCFSPNVILRGLYQETILPNLAFVGGGGELAYWMQLKDLFQHYGVIYPLLVLRNSFLLVENKWRDRIEKLGLTFQDLFQTEEELMKEIIARNAEHPVSLNGNFEKAAAFYMAVKSQAVEVDETLSKHVAALEARSVKGLQELEKKMFRAEKRKFADQQRQLQNIKASLFPNNSLQERVENFSSFYAKWGSSFINELYKASLALEQEFVVLTQS